MLHVDWRLCCRCSWFCSKSWPRESALRITSGGKAEANPRPTFKGKADVACGIGLKMSQPSSKGPRILTRQESNAHF